MTDTQTQALRAALDKLCAHMDRAGGDADGMPECPWCHAGGLSDNDEAEDRHSGDCELIAARKLLAAPPQEPTPATPDEPAFVDEDDQTIPVVTAPHDADRWGPPLRRPVPLRVLTPDDYYALQRMIDILPADPFLSSLQSRLCYDALERHGSAAGRLSGPEFVREVERVETMVRSKVSATPDLREQARAVLGALDEANDLPLVEVSDDVWERLTDAAEALRAALDATKEPSHDA